MSNIDDFTIINSFYYGVSLKKYIGGDEDVIIPDTVTCIGSRAFSRCNFVTGVSIPETVKRIESSAFYECTSLKRINIPDSVTDMGLEVFSGCTALTSVTLSQNITKIWRHTFYGCKELKSITIPNRVDGIENSAFQNCTSLQEVNIPDSVRYIDAHAFQYCISLEEVNIPNSVRSIANDAFRGCESLKRIVFKGNDVIFPVSAFDGCSSLVYNEYDNAMYLGSIVNPYNWLIKAKDNSITSCEIHPHARVVCENAFKGCKDLKHLMIPASVVEIRLDAFRDCMSLKNIEVASDSETYVYENGCLISEDVLVAVIPKREISIPSSVKIIGRHAFCNCPETVSIELQDGVEDIRGFAFEGCDNLQNIEIPDSVTSLHPYAFSGCSRKLKYLKIPKSIKRMRSTIPCMNGTIHIEGRMETFDYLPVDALKGTTKAIWLPEYCFSEIPASIRMNATLGYVYAVSMKLPKTEENSKEYVAYLRKKRVAFYPMLMDNDDLFNIMIDNKIIANDQIDNLIDLADEKGDMTKKARLINYSNGNSVVASDKLFDLDAPEGVILSSDDAKVYWTYSTVELKDGTVGISIDSYKGDEKNVTVPAKIGKKRVVRINDDAFSPVKERLPSVMVRKRRGIESVVIPDGVVEIGKNAFAYSFVKRVVFPTTLRKIEFGAFSHCQQLEAVDITEECEFGGSFVGCKLLENSNKMVVIGGKLDSCSSAKKASIQIPKSVTTVCANAFYECTKLKELVLHKNVKCVSDTLTKDHMGKSLIIASPVGSYGIEYAKTIGLKFKEI